ncbi:RapZ C-terminal domain-containing protein [Saccharothrix hoggarensis]|uniref:RapZ C-terminal domain-containing protein n=1 Tax=Saccharothrix hoggarensis TaxID=913853 RepID=A0ABW3QMM6_9PSEU
MSARRSADSPDRRVREAGRRQYTVAISCVGGRHRSVVIAEQVAHLGRCRGWRVEVENRDVDKGGLHRHPPRGGRRPVSGALSC